jgi:hypothetical protein
MTPRPTKHPAVDEPATEKPDRPRTTPQPPKLDDGSALEREDGGERDRERSEREEPEHEDDE